MRLHVDYFSLVHCWWTTQACSHSFISENEYECHHFPSSVASFLRSVEMKCLWVGARNSCSEQQSFGDCLLCCVPCLIPLEPGRDRSLLTSAMFVLLQGMADIRVCWIHPVDLGSPTLSHLNQLQIRDSFLTPLDLCVLHTSGHSLWS